MQGERYFGGIGTLANDLGIDDGSSLTYQTVNGSKQLLGNVRGNGTALTASSRRSGLEVTYAGGKFTFKSGTTGDASRINTSNKRR